MKRNDSPVWYAVTRGGVNGLLSEVNDSSCVCLMVVLTRKTNNKGQMFNMRQEDFLLSEFGAVILTADILMLTLNDI